MRTKRVAAAEGTRSRPIFAGGLVLLELLAAAAVFESVSSNETLEAAPVLAAVSLVVATAYFAVGTAGIVRRSPPAINFVLVAAGFSVLASPLFAARLPWAAAFGLAASHFLPVLVGHLLMIYPTGRFDARYQRSLIVVGYVDAIILAIPWLVLFDPTASCDGCAQNPARFINDSSSLQLLWVVRLTVSAIITTGLAIALTQRWNSSTPTRRAMLAPLICAVGATIGGFAVLFVSELANAEFSIIVALNCGVLGIALTVPLAVAYGQARGRHTRFGAVQDLVATIGDYRGQPVLIESAFAKALEDPSLRFVYWLPAKQEFVDADGRALPPSEHRHDRGWFTIESGGVPVAAVIYDRGLGDQSALLEDACSAIVGSLENVRIEAELRARVEELRESRARLVEATDRERKQIERDLHDGGQQHLISIALNLRRAAAKMQQEPDAAEQVVLDASRALTEVTEELRSLARGIHPTLLEERGLNDAVRALTDRSALPVELELDEDLALSPDIESAAYFVVSESLANATRSAAANFIRISIRARGDSLRIEIFDDGVGGASPHNGTGLNGLSDRVSALEGEMSVESPVGRGTSICVTLPAVGPIPARQNARVPDDGQDRH